MLRAASAKSGLQRARMVGGDPPRGFLLREPRSPYFVEEQEISRAGLFVERSWQRARWIDGRTFVWVGRRKTAGRGEGWSQLVLDQIVDLQAKKGLISFTCAGGIGRRLINCHQRPRISGCFVHKNVSLDLRSRMAKHDRKPSRKTSRSDTQIRQRMHGMQRMHADFC